MNPHGEWRQCIPTTFEEIVSTIVEFTDVPPADAASRVWAELLEPGWNVNRDVARFGVTPFQFDEHMARLYAESDGFIFESLVFWARPARQAWIQRALERIQRHAQRIGVSAGDLRILMFGDGPGNDSLFLASAGLTVDYYEVAGSRTYDFAVRRFRRHGLWERRIRPVEEQSAALHGRYDVVLSFEVLEHLPNPIEAIRDINSALKLGGLAVVTDDFGDLTAALPTHLKCSARYLGATPFLFLKNKMVLNWYSRDELFKPYEFVKLERVPTRARLRLLADDDVRGHYLSRHFNRLARFIAKLPHFRLRGGRD